MAMATYRPIPVHCTLAFVILTALLLCPPGATEAAYRLHFRTGNTIEIDSYQNRGDVIAYPRFGGMITVPRADIAKIEDLNTPASSSPAISFAVPPIPKEWATERREVQQPATPPHTPSDVVHPHTREPSIPTAVSPGQSTLVGGYFACVTEALFDEAVRASARNDRLGLEYVLSKGCVITRAGIPISVLDRSWGTAKVRAYPPGGTAIILWTNIENVGQ